LILQSDIDLISIYSNYFYFLIYRFIRNCPGDGGRRSRRIRRTVGCEFFADAVNRLRRINHRRISRWNCHPNRKEHNQYITGRENDDRLHGTMYYYSRPSNMGSCVLKIDYRFPTITGGGNNPRLFKLFRFRYYYTCARVTCCNMYMYYIYISGRHIYAQKQSIRNRNVRSNLMLSRLGRNSNPCVIYSRDALSIYNFR
jgi:hypothetical protein